ncbi:long-chain-fatty-acid--CoA ligase 5-like isoform X2 [Anneissia japonica]|nr:long-chain-fatty-acid--CoA ligase 5-like isoform X2 [Anneissia japonica]
MDDVWDALTYKLLVYGAATVAIGTTIYLVVQKRHFTSPGSLQKQSVLLPGDERIHISPFTKIREDGTPDLLSYTYEDGRTLYQAFVRGLAQSNNGPCLGWRPGPTESYNWLSYQEVLDRAFAVGSAIVEKGYASGQSTYIGIYSNNRPEWVIVEQACFRFNMVTVPLYDTLGPDACVHIINQAVIPVVFLDTTEKIYKLLEKAEETPSLKIIVLMVGEVSAELKSAGESKGVEVIRFDGMLKLGQEHPHKEQLPSPEDVATVCFTSGTTGLPKGVVLTHACLIADIAGVFRHIQENVEFTTSSKHFSYLPLAHMFERAIQGVVYLHGAQVGFFQGDVKILTQDIQALKPQLIPAVPRVLNRIYDRVIGQVNSSGWLKRTLFSMALNSKKKAFDRGEIQFDTIWDKLVFKKIQGILGGELRLLVSGAAPLSADKMLFFRSAMGCWVSEGYGQTECTAACTYSYPGDLTCGHVGTVIPSCMIKLIDVPDMGYSASEDKGEVCVKGPIVSKGYLKDEARTKETFDEDGWLHTGDIGEWMSSGQLKIIDRKKHIFKLSQGEYIAPEKIENVYIKSVFVAQAFVFGYSLKSCIVGIIIPDEEQLMKYAKEKSINMTFQELCKNQDICDMIFEDMEKVAKDGNLKSFEKVKKIHLSSETFSVENNLLTPTFKSRRKTIENAYKSEIDALYEQVEPATPTPSA